MTAVGVVVAFLFLGCIAAHAALVAAIVKAERWRAALAFFVPPLAVWWAWGRGVRWRVWIWVGAVAAYAIVVTVAARGEP
jgi:hypothetical protein